MLYDIESDTIRIDKLNTKEVVAYLEDGRLPLSSKIYCYDTNLWTSIPECEPVARLIILKLMKGAVSFNNDSLFHHWCLKDFTSPKGDFTLMELIHKYQNNEITGDSLVRHPRYHDWNTISSLALFEPQNVQILYQFLGLRSSFKMRENLRVKVQKNMIAKRDNQTYHGVCWSLSSKGLGFDTFEKTNFSIDDEIELTLVDFINGTEAKFICEVVSINRKANYDSIGVRFDNTCELSDDILANVIK